MGKTFAAVVRQVKRCPLSYSTDERMIVALPGIRKDESDSICALALLDLVPVVKRLQRLAEQGQSPDLGTGVYCTGCKEIGAFVEFTFQDVPSGDEASGSTGEIVERMKGFRLFSPLPDPALVRIHGCLRDKSVAGGETILEVGSRGTALYLIQKGEVEVVTVDANQVETIIAVLCEGDCFGEMSLLTGEPVSATTRARTDAELKMIRKKDFETLLVRNPTLNHYFTRLLADRLRKTSQHFIEEIEKGVMGYLSMIHPPELVQALSMTERSGSLIAKSGEKQITLVMRDGQAHQVHIEGFVDPDLDEAFYEFLEWRQGNFRFEPREDPVERTFHTDLTSLLLEGLRRIDEAGLPGT